MKLHQHSCRKVVALLDSTMSPAQEELIRRHTNLNSHIIVMLNEDEAGRFGREGIAVLCHGLLLSGFTFSTRPISNRRIFQPRKWRGCSHERRLVMDVHSSNSIPVALFRLGRICATPNALATLSQPDILTGLQRHQAGDWGDVDDDDRQANDRALKDGSRLFSVYHSTNRVKFWIITEADRSLTTVLLPQDY